MIRPWWFLQWSVDKELQVGAVGNSAFDPALYFKVGQGRLGSLLDEGNEKESDHSDTYLNHNRIEGCAEKGLDFEMLFDPSEKLFYLPTAFVQSGDGAWCPLEVVGDENVRFLVLGIDISDSPQKAGIFVFGGRTCQSDRVIGSNTQLLVHFAAFNHLRLNLRFHPGDEESAILMNAM